MANEPCELKAIAYKNDEEWSEDIVKTTGEPTRLEVTANRDRIWADGYDLSFATVKVIVDEGLTVPVASKILFSVERSGEIVATANGDQTNFTPFPSLEREAFNSIVLVIIRGVKEEPGFIRFAQQPKTLKVLKSG